VSIQDSTVSQSQRLQELIDLWKAKCKRFDGLDVYADSVLTVRGCIKQVEQILAETPRETQPVSPYAWVCRTCGKIDFADIKEQTAQPEHVSYRGVDIGTCKGKMIPLYAAPPGGPK